MNNPTDFPHRKRIFRYAPAVDAFLPSDTKLWVIFIALQAEGRRIPHGNSLMRTPQRAFLSFVCKTRKLFTANL